MMSDKEELKENTIGNLYYYADDHNLCYDYADIIQKLGTNYQNQFFSYIIPTDLLTILGKSYSKLYTKENKNFYTKVTLTFNLNNDKIKLYFYLFKKEFPNHKDWKKDIYHKQIVDSIMDSLENGPVYIFTSNSKNDNYQIDYLKYVLDTHRLMGFDTHYCKCAIAQYSANSNPFLIRAKYKNDKEKLEEYCSDLFKTILLDTSVIYLELIAKLKYIFDKVKY